MSKPLSRTLYLLLLITWVGVCASSIYYMNAAPSVTPVAAAALMSVPTAVFTATPVPTMPPTPRAIEPISQTRNAGDTSWSLLQPGLERRVINIYNAQNQPVESLYIWRLDQRFFRLDVAYNETPRSLETWQNETNAAMVINGGYYSIKDERYFPDGLTIINGKTSGHSFAGFGGMLAINQDRAELRWLVQKPYNSSEPLQAGLQSFPMLVEPGGQLGFGAGRENYANARRTVIAQDREGRILLMVAPRGYFTLHQLSSYLTNSDLNLDVAINLDGGGSTGILVANPREVIAPTRPLPFVILVYPR